MIAADQEVVRVLAPMPPAELDAWRRTALDERLARRLADKQAKTAAGGTSGPQRLTAKERAGVEAELPNDLWEALQCDTGELRKAGWSQPPGSRWVAYTRPRDSLDTALPPRRRPVAKLQPPTVARFALASKVPPRLTEAVRLAERVREALIKHSEGAPVFVGRDGESPMVGHRHAHVLPECNGAFGHISHVTVYAPMGFDAAARWALDRVRALRRRDGNHDQLVLLGVGQPEEYGGVDLASGQCPLLAKSAVWESRTPFIATRHAKRRGRAARPDENGLVAGSPEHDLRRLLAELRLPAPGAVEALEGTTLGGKLTRWLSFRAERVRGGGRRGGGGPAGFRVRFSRPVRGPIAVGYGAHFGLGQMVPARVFGVGPGDW
jgi:CRISPR-associated protein Csb2